LGKIIHEVLTEKLYIFGLFLLFAGLKKADTGDITAKG